MFIVGMLLGITIGMFIIAMISIDKINEIESLVIASRKSLKNAEDRILQKNKLIRIQNKEIQKQLEKINDLENNIDILFNNLPKEIKEVIVGKTNNFKI